MDEQEFVRRSVPSVAACTIAGWWPPGMATSRHGCPTAASCVLRRWCPRDCSRPSELCVVDFDCHQISGSRARTSELLLHLVIYRERPDVHAVVHAHPPHACAFAITGTPIPNGILAEVEVFLGVVPTVGYTLPGTPEFAESWCPTWTERTPCYWPTTVRWRSGLSLDQAYGQTEILDAYCRVLLLARSVGTVRPFTKEQVANCWPWKSGSDTRIRGANHYARRSINALSFRAKRGICRTREDSRFLASLGMTEVFSAQEPEDAHDIYFTCPAITKHASRSSGTSVLAPASAMNSALAGAVLPSLASAIARFRRATPAKGLLGYVFKN